MSSRHTEASRTKREALRAELFDHVKAGDLPLADIVRLMRRVTGKNQAEYAKLVGISPRVLMDFERGAGNPTLETLRKILAPFDLELSVRPRRRD